MPTDWRPDDFHKYAMLWVPATPSSSGTISFILDDSWVMNSFTYPYIDPNNPPGFPAQDVTGQQGLMDRRHLYLLLGTSPNNPMTVYSVSVWQKNADQDETR